MATARIKARPSNKSNQYNLSIQLRHGSERALPSLGISVPVDHWDEKRNRVKQSVRGAFGVNHKLDKYEQNFFDVFRSHGGDVADVDWKSVVEDWEESCKQLDVVDSRDVAAMYRSYVSDHKTVENKLTKKTEYVYRYLCSLLEAYVNERGSTLSVDEFATSSEFFRFGEWMKRKPMNDHTVATYLRALRGFLKFINTDEKLLEQISNKQINIKFAEKNDKEDVMLSEDLFNAVMSTQIIFDRHGRVDDRLYRERIFLDTIKLILGHGFRYSDLWAIRKQKHVLDSINIDGSQIHYFKYTSPKRLKKDIVVPFYPGTKEIIDFWADKEKPTKIRWDDLASKLRSTKLGAHIDKVRMESEGRNAAKAMRDYGIHTDPVIPIAHNKPPLPLRRGVFDKVQQVWLVQQFGADWQQHIEEPIGFMQEVEWLSGGLVKRKPLWQLLIYHYGRHTFISRAVNKEKIALGYVRDMVGHSDISVTEGYLHTKEQEILNEVGGIYKRQQELPMEQPLRKAQ
jgi:integrase